MTNSTISGNSTAGDIAHGGGIHATNGDVTLSSSTVSGNSTLADGADGGGIYTAAAMAAAGVVVSNNNALTNGGGIYNDNGTLEVVDTLFSGNQAVMGTAIVRVAELGPGHREKLAALVAERGVPVVPLDSGWVDKGISLGSGEVATLKAPRVVLAWDAPTSSLSAGWTRYVLERRFGFPVSAVRVS